MVIGGVYSSRVALLQLFTLINKKNNAPNDNQSGNTVVWDFSMCDISARKKKCMRRGIKYLVKI